MTGLEIFFSTVFAILAFHVQHSYKIMMSEIRSRTILLTHIKYWSSRLAKHEDTLNLYGKIFERAISMNSEGQKLVFSLIPASREVWNEEAEDLPSKIAIDSNDQEINPLKNSDGEIRYLQAIREGIISGELLPKSEELMDLKEVEIAGCVLLKHDLLEWIMITETISDSMNRIENEEDGAQELLKVFTNIERAKITCKILIDHCEAYSTEPPAKKLIKRLVFIN